MADLDDIYSTKLLELASDIPRSVRLEHPAASATAHSKLCGSTVTVDVNVDNARISDFAQTVHACLLGQAAAAIVGREIIGTDIDEFRNVSRTMHTMLKEKGPPPTGRWKDLALLEPVRDYKHRHTSTMLVFEAVEKALDQLRLQKEPGALSAQTSN